MIRARGRETVQVTKVMGHADDVDVQQGRARLADQHGNAEADAAADLGRRHQSEDLINARRRLLLARSHWYPIMYDLHRFMIAVARVSVNHDGKGGTAPDPLVWDQGSRRFVSLLFGLMLTWRLFLVLLVFWIIPGFRLMLVALLMMTFLLGLIVFPYWLGLLPFLVDYTGLPVLLIWVMMGSPFWSFSYFSNSGLVTGCLVRRLLDHIFELVVLFRFPLFLFQREWKFDMGVSLSAVWLGAG